MILTPENADRVLAPSVLSQAFAELWASIKARPEELRWTQILWESDLWKAREEASRLHRPLFLWAMDGDPLGCV
jgi:hypothetical protein